MAVWYLDNDDEITDAVARLRGASDAHVVFVVPPGSRIATGRINFKLLAREADSRELVMAIASPDEQVRALATSAGVITAVTPDEAEAALMRGDPLPHETEVGHVDPASHPTESSAALVASADRDDGGGRFAWRSQRVRITTVIVLVMALLGIYTAWQVLPTAEIVLTPRLGSLGPVTVPVVAMPSATEADPEAGIIPAVNIDDILLTTEETFPSTDVIMARATGSVLFSAPEQLTDQDIEAGTLLQTPAGVEFQTTEGVSLPRSIDGVSEVTAPIEAIVGGTEGNVLAQSISSAPSLEGFPITVSNPEPTNGGEEVVARLVSASDYDKAALHLRTQLGGALEAYLRDPANTPEGLTLFPETAQRGPIVYEPSEEDVVGFEAAEFTLGGSAPARVLAVDETLVDEVTRARLLGALPADQVVLGDSVAIAHGKGAAEGEHIRFEGSGQATTYLFVDEEALRDQIAGLPVSDAQAILDGFGTATVSVWPDFLGDLPGDRDRITLELVEPSTTE